MRRAVLLLLAIFLLPPPVPAAAGTSYGSGTPLDGTTAVSSILDRPSDYSGKTVKVKGLVVDVCTARGCWMELAGDRPHERIRVKVEDGAIVFPASARGKQAAVQGVVATMRMCPDEALRYRKNEAREKGVRFDPASVTGKETALSIMATGAVIE